MQLDDWQLARLRDLGDSTRRGCTDRAFPRALGELAAKGLARTVNPHGYIITEDGRELLSRERERVKKL